MLGVLEIGTLQTLFLFLLQAYGNIELICHKLAVSY